MLHCFIAFLPILFHLSQQNYRLSPRRNVTAATDELPPPQSLLLRFLKRDARKLGTSAKRERGFLARPASPNRGGATGDEADRRGCEWQSYWMAETMNHSLHEKAFHFPEERNCIVPAIQYESPESEARDQYARWHRFWWKSWFLRREKNLWSQMDQSQPTYEPKVQWLLRQPMN